MLLRIQDGNRVPRAQLRPRELPAPAVRVERDGQLASRLVPDEEPHADEVLDVGDLGQEAPVLGGHVAESVEGIVEFEVDVFLVREVGEGWEDFVVAEVGELGVVHCVGLLFCSVCRDQSRFRDMSRMN